MLKIPLLKIRTPNGDFKVPALKPKIVGGRKVLVPIKRGERLSPDVMPYWNNRSGVRDNFLLVRRGTFNLPIKISPYQTPDIIPKKPVTIFRSSPKMRPSVQPRKPVTFRSPPKMRPSVQPRNYSTIPIKKVVTVKPVIIKAKLIKPNLVKAVIKNPVTKQIKTVIAPPNIVKQQTRPIQITVATGQKPVEKSALEKLIVPIGIGLITLLMKG
jgi:hypothetical protein